MVFEQIGTGGCQSYLIAFIQMVCSYRRAVVFRTIKLVGLSDNEVLYGRDVRVGYFFKDDALALFVINFAGPGSQESFDAAREQLVKDYGSMSSPSPKDSCKIASEKKAERFAIEHCNREEGAATAEQLLVYRTPASSAVNRRRGLTSVRRPMLTMGGCSNLQILIEKCR
jgi:hypothetical protein